MTLACSGYNKNEKANVAGVLLFWLPKASGIFCTLWHYRVFLLGWPRESSQWGSWIWGKGRTYHGTNSLIAVVNGELVCRGVGENTIQFFLQRGRRKYFPQEKPKSTLLDDQLMDEPHIEYGLTWRSAKKYSGLASQNEDRTNPILGSKLLL